MNESQTVVQTYMVEETSDLVHDNDALTRWHDKVIELGLKGQTEIVTAKKSPIPFLDMNNKLQNVFLTLCPVWVNVEEYNRTPIPVEILDLIALSKKE